MRRTVLAVVAMLLVLPAWASDPGEPLDCSDWVFLEPGYSCSVFSPLGQLPNPSVWWKGKGSGIVSDSAGGLVTLQFVYRETYLGGDHTLGRTKLIRTYGQTEQTIGYIDDRLNAPGRDQIRPLYNWDVPLDRGVLPQTGFLVQPMAFDATSGTLYLFLRDSCYSCAHLYPTQHWIAAIQGFPTLFEILETYTPPSGPLSFRVPYMPEGFQYADWFDTYYGTLATVGDWSQLQPLKCGYPASQPSVGDYLTVTDTVPTPTVGAGYYYLTAARHQGDTRFGRQASGGVLTGRHPSTLPQCNQ